MSAKILTIIQARRGSTRLPDKISKPLVGKPLLVRMVDRVLKSKLAGTVVVATTTSPMDDAVEAMCKEYGYLCFRGDPEDLLDRHYQCALNYDCDTVIKIPSDCPLIDPKVIDKVIQFYQDNEGQYDFVSNLHPPTYPDGNDVEIMALKALKEAWENAELEMERQHTTPYIWERADRYKVANVTWESGLDYSMSHRWTIDYEEDYQFIKRVYDELFVDKPDFTLEDILDLIEKKPDIYQINSKFAGVNWYRDHLHELKTVSADNTRQVDTDPKK